MLVRKCKHDDYEPYVRHLRFPENRTTKYFWRRGNPPSDTDRESWERGLHLELDLGPIPPTIRRAVNDLRNLHKDKDLNEESMKQIRILLLSLVGKHLKNVMGSHYQGEPMTAEDLLDMQRWEEAEVNRRFKEKVKDHKERNPIKVYPKIPKFIHSDRDKYKQ